MSTQAPKPPSGTKHGLRIAVATVVTLAYLPVLTWAVLALIGAGPLQVMFNFVMGRECGGCTWQSQLLMFVPLALLLSTLPVLALSLYVWVRRGRRGDRQVSHINHYFATAPDRIPPATVDVDPVERRFYRDRQGRLRSLEYKDSS